MCRWVRVGSSHTEPEGFVFVLPMLSHTEQLAVSDHGQLESQEQIISARDPKQCVCVRSRV